MTEAISTGAPGENGTGAVKRGDTSGGQTSHNKEKAPTTRAVKLRILQQAAHDAGEVGPTKSVEVASYAGRVYIIIQQAELDQDGNIIPIEEET